MRSRSPQLLFIHISANGSAALPRRGLTEVASRFNGWYPRLSAIGVPLGTRHPRAKVVYLKARFFPPSSITQPFLRPFGSKRQSRAEMADYHSCVPSVASDQRSSGLMPMASFRSEMCIKISLYKGGMIVFLRGI